MIVPTPPDRFVLDGSVTLAWLFHDEQDPYADAVLAKLPGLEMLVPRLWRLEVANVLLVGERRKRCTQADTTQWLSFLSALPVIVDGVTEARAWSETINLARQNQLSVYDAAAHVGKLVAAHRGTGILPVKSAPDTAGRPCHHPISSMSLTPLISSSRSGKTRRWPRSTRVSKPPRVSWERRSTSHRHVG